MANGQNERLSRRVILSMGAASLAGAVAPAFAYSGAPFHQPQIDNKNAGSERLCGLAGDKLAALDSYVIANERQITGPDAEVAGKMVTLYFRTTDICRGYGTPNRLVLYFHTDDYDDIKAVLDGPGKVKFLGKLGSGHTIASASWQAV